MNTEKTKVVKYDPQGFIRSAAQSAPFLLTVNDELVQKFFTAMAVEQPDGSLLLPESIRSFFAVEVVYEDVPVKPDTMPIPIDALLADMPSIYDSPIDESASAFERVVKAMPGLDFEAERTEIKTAAIDRIIVDQLPVNNG